MTTEIERYQPREVAGLAAPDTDSWTGVIEQVADLASKIANTEFVPMSMRGKTAAVAAAILTGREMGIGPMVALRHIHLIKGTPGQSAELMRALVLSQGHQIRYVETTDTRCVVEGRRRGEEDWTQVTFTADQAKRAKIALGDYPQDKLVARATSRLCRRTFADVVAGMPYTTDELEELPDAPGADVEAAAPPAIEEKPKRRTAQRKTATRQAATPARDVVAESSPNRLNAAAEPPLPGEDGYDDPTATGGQDEQQQGEQPEPVTKTQLTRIHTGLTKCGISDRGERLSAASTIVGRELASSTEMTKDEAGALIDTLAMCENDGDPHGRLIELLAATRQAENDGAVDAEVVEEDTDA